jgi:FtsZ-interacting cell division protein YlmF
MNPLDGTEVFSQLLQRLMLATDEVEKIKLKDLIKICQEREERERDERKQERERERDERKQERERDERKQERERERDERKQEREQATKLLLIKETEETERTRIMRIGIFYPTTVK